MSRIETRYSHISIGLRSLSGNGQWERIEALGWNAEGFNFYHARELQEPVPEFKRGLTCFSGTITWHSINTSEEVALGALINAQIYQRAQEALHDASLRERLLKLIRVPGMLAQKRKDQPLNHYGVKVDAEPWRAITQNALSVSAVVLSLEKWSDALGPK